MKIKEVLINVAKGDESAFVELYNSTYKTVFAVAYGVVLDKGLAEDITQETFVKIYRNAYRFNPVCSGYGWIKSIARRTAIDFYRRKKQESGTVVIQDSMDFSFVDDFGDGEIIAALTAEERVFIKYVMDGYKYAEIGTRFGWSRDRMNYMMRCIKKKVNEYFKDRS